MAGARNLPYDDELQELSDDDEIRDEVYGDEVYDGDDLDDDDLDDDDFDDDDPEERNGDLPRILERPEHPVSRKHIDASAIKVLYRLHKSRYKGYLVGGSVRDLMLGRRPKDFDIGTDARPNDIRRLFRNARIIGRRFRLAHIIFHDGVIEVATFRRTPDPNDQRGGPNDLLITSDNTFGTPREDAFRRDFTINALFYNIADFTVIDYVGGIEDLENRLIRVIGDPDVRFCEDPVRMLRAVEFAGRLDFTIEKATQEGIERQRDKLLQAAPPRLTEELLQLLKSGHATDSFQWMLDLGMVDVLLPEALAMLRADELEIGTFGNVLPVLDAMVQDGRDLPDSVLLSALLLPELLVQRYEWENRSQKWLSITQFRNMANDALESFCERFMVPNLKKAHIVQGLEGFHRLCEGNFTRSQRLRFASKSYFDHALALFEIVVRATDEGHEALEDWQAAGRQRRRREPQVERPQRGRRRPRRRRH